MSGHNPPHGRLGQPNTTWSPLQVPSYVPRQPQLAHMSSERSMARSPLTWATPPTTHQDKVYSLMTGNLMNNLEINPILQGYGRNVGMPLGSVDLSLSSAARSTPSPKGAHNNVPIASTSSHSSHTSSLSTTLPSNIPNSGVHTMAGDGAGQPSSNHQTRTATPTNVGGVIQSTTAAALKERMQGPCVPPGNGGGTSNNFGIANAVNDGSSGTIGASGIRGGNGFGTGLSNRTANDLAALVSGGLLIKDAKQINSEMDGKNGRDCFPHLSGTDSVDLVKEFVLQTMHCNALSVSPKRTSPARSSVQTTLSPSRSRSPPLNLLLGTSAIDGKLGVDCLGSSFPLPNSNTPVPLSLNSDSVAPDGTAVNVSELGGSAAARAIGSLLAGTGDSVVGAHRNNPSVSPTGNSMASSEDSVDSSNSRSNSTRRRRKPERTNKMNAVPPSEDGKSIFSGAKVIGGTVLDELENLRTNHAVRGDITALAIEGINALSQGLPGAQCDLSQNSPLVSLLESSTRIGTGMHHGSEHPALDNFPPHHTQRKPLDAVPPDQQKLLENLIQSNITACNSAKSGTGQHHAVASGIIREMTAVSDEREPASVRKQVSSNARAEDKIAGMAATSNVTNFPTIKDDTLSLGNGVPSSLAATHESNCNGPAIHKTNAQEVDNHTSKTMEKANTSDSSYEEVEHKLEEMFADIDELPNKKCTENAVSKKPHKNTDIHGTNAVPPGQLACGIEDNQTAKVTDGGLVKQITNDAMDVTDETQPVKLPGTEQMANAVAAGGKKPLTPAQKRAVGGKAGAGEMVTSTPAAKRKRGPKKKGSAHGKPPIAFMEPEGTPVIRLKAVANKKKGKNGKNGKAASTGKNGKMAGKKGKLGKKGIKDAKDVSAGSLCSTGGGTVVDVGGKYKGPYVQVKSDGFHSVINTPINEEDGDKPPNKTKKFPNSLNSCERSKIRGLHVSTLSTKYDADTTDTSWMCVFCKTGPHKFRLGDLFGPYIISTSSSEFEQSQVDVNFFSMRRTREDLESRQAKEQRAAEKLKEQMESVAPKSKKRKNAALANAGQPPEAGPSSSKATQLKKGQPVTNDQPKQQALADIFYGMVKAGDHTYEVWTHEDCLVWAPGVYMVGTRVVGLEAAIWNCCRHQCQLCEHYGAVVSCLRQGCLAKAHYICAHKQNWKMTEDFQSFCKLHAEPTSSEPVEPPVVPEVVNASLPAPKKPKKKAKPNKEAGAS